MSETIEPPVESKVNESAVENSSIDEIRCTAAAAAERGDTVALAAAQKTLCELETQNPKAFLAYLTTLSNQARFDEAESLAQKALACFPTNIEVLAACARVATLSETWSVAEARWSELRSRTRGRPGPTFELARALILQSKTADAIDLLEEACKQHPDNFDLHAAAADAVTRHGNLILAERLWLALTERFPYRAKAITGLSAVLLQQRRFDDAEKLLREALSKFPDDRAFAELLARISAGRADWPECESRWAALAKRFPSLASAWHGQAFARLMLGDLAGADSLASQAVELFPHNPALLKVHARIATAAKSWADAERRWDRVRRELRSESGDLCELAVALRAQGKLAEAQHGLAQAAERFPDNTRIIRMRAELLTELGRWGEAYKLWRSAWSAAPTDRRLQEGTSEALWGAAGSPDAQDILDLDAASAASARDERQRLLQQFEPLGTDDELGLVQRFYGLEPIGLFRWGEITTSQLAALISGDFKGLGEPENTKLTLGGDYRVRDKRFGFTTHTWVREDQANRNQFLREQCRRFRFLSRNLLDDIAEAEKIFVYKSARVDDMADIFRLHKALKRNRPATLLYVRLADGKHPSGTVELESEGLLIGYLRSFIDGRTSLSIDNAGWIEICRKALVEAKHLDHVAVRGLSQRDLVLRFESLGDNCEFGYVQRHAGAEPIALLRWSATKLESLCAALESDLAGLGDPDNTELIIGDDYRAIDVASGFAMRTFSRDEHGDRDQLFEQVCRRTRFLRQRLLDDLKSGTKIFVHKTANAPQHEELLALQGAVRRHGNAALLNVRLAEPGYPNGAVRRMTDGLYIGYLDRLLTVGAGWSIAHESWLKLLQNVRNAIDEAAAIVENSSPTVRHADHLFIAADTNRVNEQHTGIFNIPSADKQAWLRILAERTEQFAQLNARFLFLLAPDKQTVYRHLLPGSYQFRQADFLVTMPCVLDVAPTLATLTKFVNLYPQTDSHWHHLGSLIVTQTILARLGINMPELDMAWLEQSYVGDLGSKLDPAEYSVRRVAKLLKARSELIYDNLIPNNGRIRIWAKSRLPADVHPSRLLLFGDSFSYDLVHFLKEVFDIVVHVHAFAVDYRIAKAFSPNYVVCEITERFVARVPNPGDGEPLTKLWEEKVKGKASLEPRLHLVEADPELFPVEAIAISRLADELFAPFQRSLTDHG